MSESEPHPSRLERFQKMFPEHEKRIRALRRLVGKIPDSARDKIGQRTRYRPLFEGEIRRVLHDREQNGDAEVARRMQEQEASLNEWTSCLDEEYSGREFTWLIHQIIAPQILGSRDSVRNQPFERRTPETYAPYPRLNREALARVMDVLLDTSRKDVRPTDFLSMYQTELRVVEERARENAAKNFENIPHVWKTYVGEKGARELVKDLADKGTGWCIAGYAQAYGTYLSKKGSQMHVCFRGDKDAGSAIYTVNGAISQIRGSAPGQHMDGDAARRAKAYIRDNLSKGNDLKDLDQKFDDVFTLTEILDGALESRDKNQRVRLLRFLYEIDRPVQSFGYGRDRRVDTLRKNRAAMKMKDAGVIFGKIAQTPEEVDSDTKAYIGPLFADLWDKLGNIKHIYTSFPDESVLLKDITLGQGPKTGKAFADAIASTKDVDGRVMTVGSYTRSMLEGKEFKTAEKEVSANLAVLSVAQLGFPQGATYQQIKDAAMKKFGLKLCPPEVGPQLRLTYKDQPNGEYLVVAMEPISDSDGLRRLFRVYCYGGERWLGNDNGGPGGGWFAGGRFVFLRK